MKVFTNSQFKALIKEIRKEAFDNGYEKGYDSGLHVGLTSDKNGIHINSNGMYQFENGESKQLITNKVE
ncbi:hypothetical protein D7X33_25530 [Butyricicoccus sp. 1XD8-22]|nr:hypothetical protein D7X33_25530 [Butyricicoccus sp. 1XD8-22]